MTKKYYFATIILLSISCYQYPVFAQDVPDSVFNYAYEQLMASRDSVRILKEANALMTETIIPKQQKVIEKDSIHIFNLNEEIYLLKGSMVDITPPPLFKWEGFLVGLGTSWYFDSTLIKSTVVNQLTRNGFLFAGARVSFQQKLIFDGEIGIPFNDRFYIRAKVGWRLF